ncbi:hypothetical protein RISK_002771 [Rhodopirellula islandica]|uniref:Uncharacterized protein n=1 Tax=Rhodopirellula islandica TaxID=595434 RepID=A0A0J1BF78_RHOIS|nr:hypothetical protein RISK_002771 [Rhodopirellula islandica]
MGNHAVNRSGEIDVFEVYNLSSPLGYGCRSAIEEFRLWIG